MDVTKRDNPDGVVPDDFRGKTGARQGRKPECRDGKGSWSYTTTVILPELTGRPWDDVSLCYVQAFKPSHIRVIGPDGMTQLDSRPGRVTVYMDKLDTIRNIKMEVELPTTKEFSTGYEMGLALNGHTAESVASQRRGSGQVYIANPKALDNINIGEAP